MDHGALLVGSGLIAGGMNALAGGGSFVTLPALIAAGVPSVPANATSSVALWPGGFASAFVYRHDQRPVAGMPFPAMLAVTLAGGVAGALLLMATPARLFDILLPWLLLVATLALAMSPHVGSWMRTRAAGHPTLTLAGQFLLGLYGGYYGGAVGLMMLALWSLIDGGGIKALAGTRTAMVSAANSIAILCFAVAGLVHWSAALLVGAGALAGGYLGARIGLRLSPKIVRGGTLMLCSAITIAFFVRTYH